VHARDKNSPESGRYANSVLERLSRARLEQGLRYRTLSVLKGDSSEATIQFGELDDQARRIAGALKRAGAVGERALLLFPHGLEFIAAFFGCLYAGTVAVPLYPPRRGSRQNERLRAVA